MTILTAQVAQVNFPVEEGFVEGLMDEEGMFLIAVPQVCRLFAVPLKNASRDFKVLLGKDVPFLTRKTSLNSKAVVAIPIEYLEPLILELAFKGNSVAIHCSRALLSLSLTQLFHDAFSIDFGVEDRQALLEAWYPVRERSVWAHKAFDHACKRKRHPGNHVHDLMTSLIFGDTAAAARLKAIVCEQLDPTIGLNHQEDIDKLSHLVSAKIKYSDLRKGTWQEQVHRAVVSTQ